MSRSRSLPALIIGAVLVGACATPAALPAPSATATLSSSPVAVANPTPVPTAVAAPTTAVAETGAPDVDSVPFVAGSAVKTLADDGLRVRSKPSTDETSSKRELLPLATPLLILDGPVSGSGYEWYEVASLASSTPGRGWVAAASREGEPWVAPAEFDCPAMPTDMRSLLDLQPAVAVLCFADEPITVEARLQSCECEVDGPGYSPSWFSYGGGDLLVEADRTTPPGTMDDAIPLSLDPAGDYPDTLPLGEVVEVTGVFDHPAASGCTLTSDRGGPVATSDCRFWFAVTRLAADE